MITRGRETAERIGRGPAIRTAFFVVLAIFAAAGASPSQAGPCTGEIDRLQAQLDAMIDTQAGEGEPHGRAVVRWRAISRPPSPFSKPRRIWARELRSATHRLRWLGRGSRRAKAMPRPARKRWRGLAARLSDRTSDESWLSRGVRRASPRIEWSKPHSRNP